MDPQHGDDAENGIEDQAEDRAEKSMTPVASELAEFAQRGYVVLRGALRPGVAQGLASFVYGEYERHKLAYRQHTGHSLDDREHRAALAADPASFDALPSDLKHLARGELPLQVRLDARLRVVAHEERLARVLRQLLASESLRLHNPPSVRISVPGIGIGNVPVHQDFAYNLHVQDFLTVWVPLCPIDDACGGVDVLEGSHRVPSLAHSPLGIWSSAIDPRQAEPYPRRHVLLELGDVLIFGPYLLHASHPNSSERTRASIDYRFFSAATPSLKHFYDVARRVVVAPEPAAGGAR